MALKQAFRVRRASLSTCTTMRLHGSDWKEDPVWTNPLSGERKAQAVDQLHTFLDTYQHGLAVITGAGVSTASGIPDYRGQNGSYRNGHKPVSHQAFLTKEISRKRYWARSMIGWARMEGSSPNNAHRVLSELETRGAVAGIITQNVDGLHQEAGSANVIDLHGRIDQVKCMGCGNVSPRRDLQARLEALNPTWIDSIKEIRVRADGDAELESVSEDGRPFYEEFHPPDCVHCGGMLKPDVVLFGDSVPRDVVEEASRLVANSSAILVVGTSLEVYSVYRFLDQHVVKSPHPKPLAILNLGETRAERAGVPLLKVDLPCEDILHDYILSRPHSR